MTSLLPNTTLITGANGLIGSHLARRYLAAGKPVAALRRTTSDLSLLTDVEDQITWLEGDILDIPSLQTAIQPGIDVIHTAAIVSFIPKDRPRMDKINVEGTANVVNVCLEKGIHKLGFLSSVAALGRPEPKGIKSTQPIVINKEQRWEDSPNNSFYAQTKYRAELEVWRGISEGLNAVMVNPTIVVGEGDWAKSSSQLFRYAYDEKPFYPAGVVNLVDVKDVAEALFQLMQSNVSAERFILNAATLPYKTFLDKIADAFGRKRPAYGVSPALTQLLWPLEAVRSWITGKAPLITRETARSASMAFQYDGQEIEQVVPFHYRNVDETIERICAFYTRKATRQ